jgi:peptide-methionine (R)-S-oxide reductase
MTVKQINPNLTEEQKEVLFDKATETPFTGQFLENKEAGMYTCANCDKTLFSSDTKFESGSGWPSFYDVAKSGAIKLIPDNTLGMERTEVVCANCGAHLGHLFHDAVDQPTGERYCVNGTALGFKTHQKTK